LLTRCAKPLIIDAKRLSNGRATAIHLSRLLSITEQTKMHKARKNRPLSPTESLAQKRRCR